MLLPISSSIDCFLFQILFHITALQAIPTPLQRSILILFSAQTPSPCLEITKPGSCWIQLLYPAQKAFDTHYKVLRGSRTKAGELWPAAMKPHVDCSNQQGNWIQPQTQVWFQKPKENLRYSQICALRSVHFTSSPISKPHEDLLTILFWLWTFRAVEGNLGPLGQNWVYSCPGFDCWDGQGRRPQKLDQAGYAATRM